MKAVQNIEGIQKVNRCTVIQLMIEQKVISRADIARMTGLNKATVTNIINETLEMGIVVDYGSILDSNGRKSAGLSLNLESVVILVIKINREVIDFGICTITGDLTYRIQKNFSINENIETILQIIQDGIHEIINTSKCKHILSVSIATPGHLIDGIIHHDDMPQLSQVDFKKEVEKMLPGTKVLIERDINSLSFVEWKDYKARTGSKEGIVATVGFNQGIHDSFMIDGKLLRRGLGISGGFGNMNINFNVGEKVPLTYKGILESYASPQVMRRKAIEKISEFPNSKITENSSLAEFYKLYDQNDDLAVWAINRMCWFLAYGLSSLIFILNPHAIILGGKIIRSQGFMKKLKQYMDEFLPSEIMRDLDISFSKYQDEGIIIGASIMAVDTCIKSLYMFDFLRDNFPRE